MDARTLTTPVLRRGEHWLVALNRNQNLLGKAMIVLLRENELVTAVTAAEWTELHEHLVWTTRRLRDAFAPDHFNYAFLQNQDRQVHLHVVPRYASPREFAGLVFEDPDWPGHYMPGVERLLESAAYAALADALA